MTQNAQMVIANRLRDGLTVFLAEGGLWVESISAGAVAGDRPAAESLLRLAHDAAAGNIVVNPYLIAITEQGGNRRPVDWREAIRASGPTVETGRPG